MSSFYVPTQSLLQSRAFRRLLAYSLAGHVIVFLALVIHPFRRGELIATSPVMVQMVSMPKAAKPAPAPAPAKPAPKPKPPEEKPAEPPPPPKPVVKEIVIPKEPKPLPEKPKAEPKTPPPSAEELLSKMTERVEAQEAAKAPPQEAPAEAGPAAAEASPGRFDPVLSPWLANVKARVRANWSGASVCKGEPQFDVDVDAAGQLTHIELVHSSGDSYCDDTAERALRKSNPLPPPPQAMSFTFNLNPKDLQ